MDFRDLFGDGGFGEFDDQAAADGAPGSNPQDLFMFGLNTQEMEDLKQ